MLQQSHQQQHWNLKDMYIKCPKSKHPPQELDISTSTFSNRMYEKEWFASVPRRETTYTNKKVKLLWNSSTLVHKNGSSTQTLKNTDWKLLESRRNPTSTVPLERYFCRSSQRFCKICFGQLHTGWRCIPQGKSPTQVQWTVCLLLHNEDRPEEVRHHRCWLDRTNSHYSLGRCNCESEHQHLLQL